MYNNKQKVEGKFNQERIWTLYEDISKWLEWDKTLEEATLLEGFVVGSNGKMKNIGMPEIEFTLIEVTKGKSFTTKSIMGPFQVEVSHQLSQSLNEEIVIEHGVKVSGPDEEKVQRIGNSIYQSFSSALKKLGELSS